MRALWFLAVVYAGQGEAAAIASGRHWQISIDSVECESAEALVTIGMRVDYRGPKGAVETPVSQLVDGKGRQHPPRSLVWRSGSRPLVELLSAGGLRNIQSENVAEIQLKFAVRDATGDLKLEFGDLRAISLTRKRSGGACEGLLKPDQIQGPRGSRPARADSSKASVPIYRSTYPCFSQGAWKSIKADYPPYVPRQLLVFGRGYLPGARQIELPMGKAPAQSYSYVGADDLKAVEVAAQRTVMTDFPEYVGAKHFAFNWGPQLSQSGNPAYSIGLYDVRACPR